MPKYNVTHTVFRAEYYTVSVEAESIIEAIEKADIELEDVHPAEYYPGGIVDDSGEYEVDEITPLSEGD